MKSNTLSNFLTSCFLVCAHFETLAFLRVFLISALMILQAIMMLSWYLNFLLLESDLDYSNIL